MKGTIQGKWLLAGAMLVSATLAAAAPETATIIDDRAQHQARLLSVSARTADIHKTANGGHVDALLSDMLDIKEDPDLDGAVREHLLETAVIALSQTQPDTRARKLVSELRLRPVTVYVRMIEEHGDAVVPMYDVGAAARFTERTWSIRESSDQVMALMLSGQWTPATFDSPPAEVLAEHWRSGTVLAIRRLPLDVVNAHKHSLRSALPNAPLLDSVVVEAAARTEDPLLYGVLPQHARDVTLLQAVRTSSAILGHDDARHFLQQCADRPAAASAAILELGRLARTDYTAREWLLQRLGDPAHGASAALALARMNEPTVFEEVRDMIAGDHAELAKLRAALVLRLSELPSAAAIRQQLLASATLDRTLQDALR